MMMRSIVCLLALMAHGAIAADSEGRVISVSGRGQVKAVPDRATVQLGVEARRLSLDEARKQVTAVVATFLDYCEALDIPEEKISTSGVTIRPEYTWNNNVRRLTGYFVGRNLVIDVTELDKLGELIEGAVDQGVNQVSEPVFGLTDQGRYQRQAMTLAAADARRNAETLAEALDVAVGPLVSIAAQAASAPPPPRPMMAARMAEADAGGAETYRSGEITFSIQVQARFAIGD